MISAARVQRGFSLIELSVAILIALFLIGGVLVVEQGVHRAYADQSGLSQLQDEERFAMSTLRNVVESAGYFPDPTNNTPTTAFAAAAPFQASQAIYSPPSSATPPTDSLYVRFMTSASNNVQLCDGTSAGGATYTTYLYVQSGNLYCQVETGTTWGNAVELVGGVTDMSILYGVSTGADNNVDTYLTPGQMTGQWLNVSSVMVTLTFTNPLYASAPSMQPQTVTFRQVIGVMGRT